MSTVRPGFLRVIDVEYALSITRQLFATIMAGTIIMAGGLLVILLAVIAHSSYWIIIIGVLSTIAGAMILSATYNMLFNQIANGRID